MHGPCLKHQISPGLEGAAPFFPDIARQIQVFVLQEMRTNYCCFIARAAQIIFLSDVAMSKKRTELCAFWLRGDCRNGSKCSFAHGATQLRRPEDNSHTEDQRLRKAVQGEAAAPEQLLKWREQLSGLQAGRQVCFEGLRPTERYALHQLANEFQLTHMSTGVGDQRRLHILKPLKIEESQPSEARTTGRLSRAEQKRRKKERLRSRAASSGGYQESQASGSQLQAEEKDDDMGENEDRVTRPGGFFDFDDLDG